MIFVAVNRTVGTTAATYWRVSSSTAAHGFLDFSYIIEPEGIMVADVVAVKRYQYDKICKHKCR